MWRYAGYGAGMGRAPDEGWVGASRNIDIFHTVGVMFHTCGLAFDHTCGFSHTCCFGHSPVWRWCTRMITRLVMVTRVVLVQAAETPVGRCFTHVVGIFQTCLVLVITRVKFSSQS